MTTSNTSYRGDAGTIGATFADRDSAADALHELHGAGFRNVWLGVTRGDTTTTGGATVESEETSGGIMGSIGRFFSGEGAETRALHQALIDHGMGQEQARRLEATVPDNCAIVTVQGENDPDEAIDILKRNGGSIDTSSIGSEASTKDRVAGTSDVVATAGAGSDVDDTRRLQLREERLLVDKERIASGEARVGKAVVSEQQTIDVPVFHEELFIQRRPVTGVDASSSGRVGDSEDIRIPLSEERVNVEKRTVVTEEVAVGKRKVEGMEHVSDSVRREELRVDEDTTSSRKTDIDRDDTNLR